MVFNLSLSILLTRSRELNSLVDLGNGDLDYVLFIIKKLESQAFFAFCQVFISLLYFAEALNSASL